QSLEMGGASLALLLILKVTGLAKHIAHTTTPLFKHALYFSTINSVTFGILLYSSGRIQESFEIKDKRGRFALHATGVLSWIFSRYLVAKLFNQSFGANFSRSYMHLDTSILSILASSEALLSSFREKGEGRDQAANHLVGFFKP
ncbi:MAG: hypothetical protein K1060chlam2_00045, partial [Chlamydiae bacterium]|nr:hypothetical protein [Chlamydiota bacterium]